MCKVTTWGNGFTHVEEDNRMEWEDDNRGDHMDGSRALGCPQGQGESRDRGQVWKIAKLPRGEGAMSKRSTHSSRGREAVSRRPTHCSGRGVVALRKCSHFSGRAGAVSVQCRRQHCTNTYILSLHHSIRVNLHPLYLLLILLFTLFHIIAIAVLCKDLPSACVVSPLDVNCRWYLHCSPVINQRQCLHCGSALSICRG